jgi:hypothetical protein
VSLNNLIYGKVVMLVRVRCPAKYVTVSVRAVHAEHHFG